MAHTAGPWTADEEGAVFSAADTCVACCETPDLPGEWRHNARLVSAAPELLAACQAALLALRATSQAAKDYSSETALLRAAICKATGQ